jgi:DNA ligase-1
MKTLPTLYSRTSTNAIQQWTIKIDKDQFWTEYGQIDGKIIIGTPTIAQITNDGKANARDPEQQALAQAKALWKKKKESGYWEDINNIDKAAFIEPMLAQKYEDRIDELVYPLWNQPKLDGSRCICSDKGMQSRGGKPIVSCPHIFRKLKKVFADHPNIIFDGELYCDKLSQDFNKLMSIVKKTKPTENDLMESDATIQYWIYDLVDTTNSFSVRSKLIKEIFKEYKLDDSFVRVETTLVNNEKELTKLYEEYIENGYEGQMIRVDAPYEQKRSKNLLKRKEFQDREYPIVDICEGEGGRTSTVGYMILMNDNGETFKSNVKGDRSYLKEILKDRKKYIGKQATVKYFNLTPDKQVPRFPYVIAIRDYE